MRTSLAFHGQSKLKYMERLIYSDWLIYLDIQWTILKRANINIIQRNCFVSTTWSAIQTDCRFVALYMYPLFHNPVIIEQFVNPFLFSVLFFR